MNDADDLTLAKDFAKQITKAADVLNGAILAAASVGVETTVKVERSYSLGSHPHTDIVVTACVLRLPR